ncbi:hypothetical protein PTKIN_Ptkin06aG0185300 [Pterospermum kingtungense]
MAIRFFAALAMVPGLRRPDILSVEDTQDTKHLLGLVHKHCLPSPQESNLSRKSIIFRGHLDQWEMDLIMGLSFIRSATELSEAGIRFKKRDEGKMHIPTLTVDYDTERIFRNLIAYEQIHQGPSIVMDYARLMNCLINYADDVALLCDARIIDNRFGTNEEVANMFNMLNDFVHFSRGNFYYSELFHDVTEHCSRPLALDTMKAKLKKKYANTPWDWILISIIAAAILLLLSFLQTLYSVLSYYK